MNAALSPLWVLNLVSGGTLIPGIFGRTKTRLPMLWLICVAAVWVKPAFGQASLFWTGQNNGDWGSPLNWTTDPNDATQHSLPQNGDELYFGFNPFGDSNENMTNDMIGLSVSAMHFGNNSYELNGNALTVGLIDNTDQNGVENGFGVNSETVDVNCPLVVMGSLEVDSGNAPGNLTQTTLYTHLYGPITFEGQGAFLNLLAESSPGGGGGNGNIYVAGGISGDGDVYAQVDDDGNGDVSSVEFNGTNGNTFSGTLYVSTSGNAQIIFNQASGYVATNDVKAYPYLGRYASKADNISLAALNQLGDYTVLGVSGGLTLHLSGHNVTVGSLILENDAEDTNASTLDIDGMELGLNYALNSHDNSTSVTPIITGYINLNGLINCQVTGVDYAGLDLAATLASVGGLSISGNNALLLEASNAFSGPVIINSGSTLDLRTNSALRPSSNGVQLNGGNLTLTSVNIPEGIVLNVTASNSMLIAYGPCSWGNNFSFNLDYQLSVFAFDSLQLNGPITGTGGLTLYGETIALGGGAGNTYSGTTFCLCTLLTLSNGLAEAFNGTRSPLVIGNSNGTPCEVRWLESYQLFNPNAAAQPAVTIYPGSLMNLNGFQDLIGSLTFNGGTVELGTSGVLMPGPILVNPNSAQVSIEGGQLDTGPQLGSVTFPASSVSTIDVEQASLYNALIISSTIVGDYGITKNGPGTMALSGSNSFTGENWISNGVVNVGNPTALGSVANATTVEPGGTLALETNVTIGPVLTNNGAVLLLSGTTLYLSSGLTNSGLVAIPAGATLTLGFGSASGSTSDSVISGAGNLLVNGSANFVGTVNVAGSNIFNLPEFNVANMTGDYTCTNNVLSIEGGIANLNGTGMIAPATLTVSSYCTLGGSNLVTVSGPATFNTESALSGTNLVVANGGLTISGSLGITGRTLVNNGTCAWNGAGTIGLNSGATLSNGPAGTFDCTADGMVQNGPGGNLVANVGIFAKTGGTSSTTISVPFENFGTVEVQTATLSLAGGLSNLGAVIIDSGSTLDVGGSGDNSLSTLSSSIMGAGNVVFGGTGNFAGTVNVGGANTFNTGTATFTGPYTCTNNAMTINGTANFNGTGIVAPGTLTMNVNSTLGGSNLVTINGPALLGLSASLSGSNRVVANGSLTILPGVNISGRTLVNAATGIWTNSLGGVASIGISGGAVISNAPGASLEFNGNGTVQMSTGGGTVVNAGTLLKTGAGSFSTLQVPFTNDGPVNIEAGTLAISDGGTSSADISVASNAGILFGGGTFTLPPGISITGPGNFTVSGGTPTFAGTVNLGSANAISGGTATFTGPYTCTNNALTIGGTAIFNGTGMIAPSTLTVSTFGTLGGSNLVTVSGAALLGVASSLSGTNLVVANGGLTILPGFNISGRTLVNTAAALWTNTQGGVMSLDMSGGAVLSNAPGGIFDMDGNGTIGFSTGGAAVVNAGTLLKTGASSTSTLSVPFTNNGTVELQSGLLAANNGYVSTSKSVLNCTLAGTSPGATYGQLQVAGAVTLNGALGVNFASNYSPRTNDSFTVLTAGTRNGTFASFSYPSNLVTMQITNTATSIVVRVTGVIGPPPVVLYIEQANAGKSLCYWSTNLSGYHLEYNGGFAASNWAASLNTPVVVGTNFVVTNSMSAAKRFYRLSSVAAPYTPPAPALNIQLKSGVVQLLWPFDSDRRFRLQSTTTLSPTNWTPISAAPSISGPNNVLTNSLTGPHMFYRLSGQ